jgi:hypothetical protein
MSLILYQTPDRCDNASQRWVKFILLLRKSTLNIAFPFIKEAAATGLKFYRKPPDACVCISLWSSALFPSGAVRNLNSLYFHFPHANISRTGPEEWNKDK